MEMVIIDPKQVAKVLEQELRPDVNVQSEIEKIDLEIERLMVKGTKYYNKHGKNDPGIINECVRLKLEKDRIYGEWMLNV